jgi:beta-phosphoglucomutase-like phosphatase (HAD superfamily)
VPVVTCDQVPHAKPDQDLFLDDALRLWVPVSSAFVVVDSVWDLLAARWTLEIDQPSGGHRQDELERASACQVYKEHADVMRHLDKVGVPTTE